MAAWISRATRGSGGAAGLARACWATALSSSPSPALGLGSTPLLQVQLQARRQVMVEVRDNNVEVALRRLKRKLKEDGSINLLRDQQYHVKPAEQRVLDRKARDLRVSKKEFRYKLRWIMDRRSRGF